MTEICRDAKTVNEKVEDLLSRMNPAEKVARYSIQSSPERKYWNG